MSKLNQLIKEAQDYLTNDIINVIIDGIKVKIKVLDQKLKELEGRIN